MTDIDIDTTEPTVKDLRDGERVDWTALGVPPTMAVFHQGGTLFYVWDGVHSAGVDLEGMNRAESNRAIFAAVQLLERQKPLWKNRSARRRGEAVDKRLDS